MRQGILKIALLITVIVGFTFSCKKEKKENQIPQQDTVATQSYHSTVNQEAIDRILGSFPSPVQMSALIKSLNVPFSKRYLLDPSKTENYDTNNKKALALGILSADLGYLNIYERSTLIIEYLSAIKKLADQLRVGQFFDFQALKRMATDNDIQNLLINSVESFQSMHQHLSATGRSNLSLLMITGVWLEGLYLLCAVTDESLKHKGNIENFESKYQRLRERIGEQKVLFELLYPVLNLYKDDPYFQELLKDLDEIKTIYEGVDIQVIKGENIIDTTGGSYVVTQGDSTVVIITDDQVKALISTTKKIRNKLINL